MTSKDFECEIHLERYCYKEYDCDKCGEGCSKCRRKCKVIADVIFQYAPEDITLAYSFNKSDKRKNITVISSDEDMFRELAYINTYIGKHLKEESDYLNKLDMLKSYAVNFAKELQKEYLPLFSAEILPIMFYEYSNIQDYSCVGSSHMKSKQSSIKIYSCKPRDIKDLQQTIRHEVIHYALYSSELNYKDDTGVFHALATLLDAHPYKQLDDKEQYKSDMLLKAMANIDLISSHMNEYYIKCHSQETVDLKSLIYSLIMQTGNADESKQHFADKYFKYLESILLQEVS